jgi:hypothetical protein
MSNDFFAWLVITLLCAVVSFVVPAVLYRSVEPVVIAMATGHTALWSTVVFLGIKQGSL